MSGLKGMPWGQLMVVALMRFAEPVSFTSLFPYIYFMVKRFEICPEEDIARYAGYISGIFALCQTLTGILWGVASDKFGRKPVVLIGLTGSAVSLLVFGLSTNYYMAVGARCIAGLLNGNVGVIRTLLGEIATKRSHQAVAFSIMPLLWQVGCVIGPMLGGYLAEPVETHPEWFSKGSKAYILFSKYPFLLPNIIVSSVLVLGMSVAFLFLKETHEDYQDRYDIGRALSSRLLGVFRGSKCSEKSDQDDDSRESSPLLEDPEASEDYGARKPVSTARIEEVDQSWGAILTPYVRRSLVSAGLLALHCMVYDELLPIFLETGVDPTSKAPFSLRGGLGMDAERVGNLLSLNGFIGIFMMLVVFPWIDSTFGTLVPYRISLWCYPAVYFVVPYFVLLVKQTAGVRDFALIVSLFIRTVVNATANPLLLLLTNRAPAHSRHLGVVNGCVQVCSSLARAIGPIVWGILMTTGQSHGWAQLPWWMLTAVALIGAIQSKWLIDRDDDGNIIH
uniref:ARAD1A13112p n=1 Tax=Blastobotrys adeninivorans TaxID=409370 RepID=A0A060SXH1_BLAAD